MDSTSEIVHSRFKKSRLIAGGSPYSQMKFQGSELPFPQANNFLVVRNKLHCKISSYKIWVIQMQIVLFYWFAMRYTYLHRVVGFICIVVMAYGF